MYAICRPTEPINHEAIREETEWAIKYGTYTPPRAASLKVLATTPDYGVAKLICQTLADRDQSETDMRVMTLSSGISDTPLHISIHTPTPLEEEIDAALDAFDGVPADTTGGSQIR